MMDHALREEQFGTDLESHHLASAVLTSLVLFDLIIHPHYPPFGMNM